MYFSLTSLDGFIADADGTFDQVMHVWDDFDLDSLSPPEREFAVIWRDIDKIVYSATLTSVDSPRTELRASFDADEVRRLTEPVDHPVSIGGGEIASLAQD